MSSFLNKIEKILYELQRRHLAIKKLKRAGLKAVFFENSRTT